MKEQTKETENAHNAMKMNYKIESIEFIVQAKNHTFVIGVDVIGVLHDPMS